MYNFPNYFSLIHCNNIFYQCTVMYTEGKDYIIPVYIMQAMWSRRITPHIFKVCAGGGKWSTSCPSCLYAR